MFRAWLLILLAVGCGDDAAMNSPPDGSLPIDATQQNDAAPPPTTTIHVHYPAGTHTLSIRGSAGPLDWNAGQAMTAGADDTWTYSTTAITAATEWKPLVDDTTWSRGPNYTVAPGQTVDVWPHFFTVNGQVTKLIDPFHSTYLPDDRTVWAYLPPSYDENTRATFPVLYMHDGQNLFDPALAFGGIEWQVDETMNAGAEDATIREAIVIGIGNTAARIYEYTPTRDASVGDGGGADQYLQLITLELKPMIDTMLRTRSGRDDTAILGSSLGGLVSAYAGTTHADTFGLVGAMSPSTWWDNLVIIGDVRASAMRPLRVYVDSGDSGTSNDDVTNTNMLADTYVSVGYVAGTTFEHIVQAGGQHNEYYWAQRLPGALRFLLGPR